MTPEMILTISLIVVITISIVLDCILIYKSIKGKPISDEELTKFKEWLLFAVEEAEAMYGGGTGAIKLRYVYDLAVSKFPAITSFISFETFAKLVDEALELLKKIAEDNEEVAKLIEED